MALIDGKQVKNDSVGLAKIKNDASQGLVTLATGSELGAADPPSTGDAYANKTYVDAQVGAGAIQVETVNAASVTTTDEDDAVSDIFGANDPRAGSEPEIYVNGVKQEVGDGVKTADCYFAESATPGTAIAFSALNGDEDLQWVGSVAGFELAATDEIACRFTI